MTTPSEKMKLFKFFFLKKSRSDGPMSHLLKRTLPAVRPSLNYSVMQYLLNTKNKMHFDPVVVLNHFVAPGVAEPSMMGRANEQGGSLDKRIRSRIGFFVESSTGEKKCLAEAKKRLTHFIRQANDLRFAGTTKTTISLFPFFGATFFFPRDGVGVYNNRFLEDAREQLLGQLRIKCWNLMGKEKIYVSRTEKYVAGFARSTTAGPKKGMAAHGGNPGSGSGGGIIRNHNGEFLEAFCHFYGVVTSVEAEFRALRDGLDLCEDLCTHLEIECDSQVIVEAVSKRRNVPWKVRDLWLDILDSLRRITWTISHVFREGNCVADCLASISGDLNSDQVFFFASEFPRPVRLALQSDYIGLPI
ncbi:hypothetical protein MRB53_018795 [Persea americana]|uniref:Uncharacterized protein n=1 Tax=Persea americana TaxID=3435 RepID=A0ACC2M8F7_PERAE|nr:hypothetical protein MRB53_018795 [Persea americana]